MTEWSDVSFVIGAGLVTAHAMLGGYKLLLVMIAHALGIAVPFCVMRERSPGLCRRSINRTATSHMFGWQQLRIAAN
jgi:hypothetical protein